MNQKSLDNVDELKVTKENIKNIISEKKIMEKEKGQEKIILKELINNMKDDVLSLQESNIDLKDKIKQNTQKQHNEFFINFHLFILSNLTDHLA